MLTETIGKVLALGGAILTLLSAIGVVRMPDTLSRMHALTKASTVGVVFVAVGGAIALDGLNGKTSAFLIAALQILTLPLAANLIARSAYWSHGIPQGSDTVDELRAELERGQDASDP